MAKFLCAKIANDSLAQALIREGDQRSPGPSWRHPSCPSTLDPSFQILDKIRTDALVGAAQRRRGSTGL